MEKQTTIINKIKRVGNTGSGLNLGVKKNDECYTSMQDILNELSYWAALDKFRGKNIICPCDWDITDDEEIYSINIVYKDLDVEVIGNNVYKAVKKVSYKKYIEAEYTDAIDLASAIPQDSLQLVTIDLAEDEIEDFLRDKLTCNFLKTLTEYARAWGIKSITASGYNPANNRGIKFQDVDYSKYDICVTNPPFSLYSEFLDTLLKYKIDFIVLAPFMNRANPCFGLPLMLGQIFLGHSADTKAGYIPMCFDNPTAKNKFNTKKVACDWITTFNEAQLNRNKRKLITGIKYELYKDSYSEMPNMTMRDGTHPLRVACDAIPEDYEGWMFSAPNMIAYISFDEYEWYVTECRRYFNKVNPAANPFNHKVSNENYMVNGKKNFAGIVFRKKPTND